MTNIGFIGLGNMGFPMAQNLLKSEHNIIVYDIREENSKKLQNCGAKRGKNIVHIANNCDIIISMLPSTKDVKEIMLGKGKNGAIFANSKENSLIIDCSSIDVKASRELAAKAKQNNLSYIDAPVSGGVMGAKNACLTFMCGGEKNDFLRALPILKLMGKNIIHAGSAGSGQAAKICNNMLLAISMIGVSEAFNLADSLGLDRQKLFDIASNSSGQCWSLNTYCPVPGPVETAPSNNNYRPGFSAFMMLKDLLLSQNAADENNIITPLGRKAKNLYEDFVAGGNGETDFSAIIKYLRRLEN